MTDPREELRRAEIAGWTEFSALIDSLDSRQRQAPGYFLEGWSAKDLLAHIGTWLAETGVILEQIRGGTYRGDPVDIDAMNEQFLEAMSEMPFDVVHAQAHSARSHLLGAWMALGEITAEAEHWFRTRGPAHYRDHLPRLREWVDELTAGA